MSAFFGLTSTYRHALFTQIHKLVYHGGGGFIHSEVYDMPIWLRHFHLNQIIEFNQKQKEEYDKINKKNQTPSNNKITGPNIDPSSTYNF